MKLLSYLTNSTHQSLRVCLYSRPAYYNSLFAGILLTLLEKTSMAMSPARVQSYSSYVVDNGNCSRSTGHLNNSDNSQRSVSKKCNSVHSKKFLLFMATRHLINSSCYGGYFATSVKLLNWDMLISHQYWPIVALKKQYQYNSGNVHTANIWLYKKHFVAVFLLSH